MAIYAPPIGLEPSVQAHLQTLREAAQDRRRLKVQYRDAKEEVTERILRPLGCFYWGKVWTLAAWCETRNDFRSFRLDRMQEIQTIEGKSAQFKDEVGKTLADYLRSTAPPRIQDALDGTA
jgi:predicted DNA-binding transcriptional regulator YafY